MMWYSGRGASSPAVDCVTPASGSVGVTVSSDGINWSRGTGMVQGSRGIEARSDVGMFLEPNQDWWTFDTCHISVSDVQVGLTVRPRPVSPVLPRVNLKA